MVARPGDLPMLDAGVSYRLPRCLCVVILNAPRGYENPGGHRPGFYYFTIFVAGGGPTFCLLAEAAAKLPCLFSQGLGTCAGVTGGTGGWLVFRDFPLGHEPPKNHEREEKEGRV